MVSIENGRYKIVTDKRELLLPACSMFNRADDEPYYVDTDYDFDEGRCYIGASDIEDMAKTIGWVEGTAYRNLKKKYDALEDKYDRVIGAINDLGVNLDSIHTAVDAVLVVEAEPGPKPLPRARPKPTPKPEPTTPIFDFGFDDLPEPLAEP